MSGSVEQSSYRHRDVLLVPVGRTTGRGHITACGFDQRETRGRAFLFKGPNLLAPHRVEATFAWTHGT
jgi:hypothetical protein